MKCKTVGIALTVAILAGAAQGQFDYKEEGDVSGGEFESKTRILWDGNSAVQHNNFGTPGAGFVDTGDLFLPTRTTLQDSYALDTTNYPSINQLQSQATFIGEAQNNFFEFSWDTSYQTDFADVVNPTGADLFLRPIRSGIPTGLSIGITEDTQIRITLNVELGGAIGEDLGSTGQLSNLAYFTFGGDALPNAFSAGAGVANDLGSSFSAVFDVSEGTLLEFEYWIDNYMDEGAVITDGFTDVNQSNRGSLTIEVIPAPASASVLVFSGILASRRRR